MHESHAFDPVMVRLVEDRASGALVASAQTSAGALIYCAGRTSADVAGLAYCHAAGIDRGFISHPAFDAHPSADAAIEALRDLERSTASM